jgi:hypothetical protein
MCASCGLGVAAEIVAGGASNGVPGFLLCPICGEGSVKLKSGAVYPVAPAGGTVKHLPKDVEQAWREARTSFAVAAYTASEIMCRKILMHVAVDAAGSKTGKRFVDYVDDLENAHYLSPGTKPVIDLVRDRGNAANHDLPASTEPEALQTLTITEHLLRSVYELPGLVTT